MLEPEEDEPNTGLIKYALENGISPEVRKACLAAPKEKSFLFQIGDPPEVGEEDILKQHGLFLLLLERFPDTVPDKTTLSAGIQVYDKNTNTN